MIKLILILISFSSFSSMSCQFYLSDSVILLKKEIQAKDLALYADQCSLDQLTNKIEELKANSSNLSDCAHYHVDYQVQGPALAEYDSDNIQCQFNAETSEFTLNGKKYPFTVQRQETLLISNRPISSHQKLDASFFKKMGSASAIKGLEITVDDLKYFQTTQSLAKGTQLEAHHLKPIKIIRPGSLIEVIYDTTSLQLKTSGRAMHGAGLGESLQVQNLQSKKIFEGVVINQQTVRIRQ